MPGQREYTAEDHLDELAASITNADHHVSEVIALLEDGGTDWDRRVKDLAGLISIAEREMRVIRRQFKENNPTQK